MRWIARREAFLLDTLHEMKPDSSKNTLRSWLQTGRVAINGKSADRANFPVGAGQEITIGPRVSFIKGGLRILHEDAHIVVLEKPAGLLSVATNTEKNATVHAMLKRRFHQRRIYPVHRLDRETSGIMVFVYTGQARNHLKEQFEKQRVEKTYLAIVAGSVQCKRGTWESYLEEDDFYYVKTTQNVTKGKRAVTEYEVLQSTDHRTLLQLHPKTGRKNQIRVHCSEAGHPVLGDHKYGAPYDPIQRLCLHAHKIGFIHPVTGKKMTFSSLIPTGFLTAIVAKIAPFQ